MDKIAVGHQFVSEVVKICCWLGWRHSKEMNWGFIYDSSKRNREMIFTYIQRAKKTKQHTNKKNNIYSFTCRERVYEKERMWNAAYGRVKLRSWFALRKILAWTTEIIYLPHPMTEFMSFPFIALNTTLPSSNKQSQLAEKVEQSQNLKMYFPHYQCCCIIELNIMQVNSTYYFWLW